MVYGAINEKGEEYNTDMRRVFQSIHNKQKDYNWLITDCVCDPRDPETNEKLSQEYCWMSGEELTELISRENFQWKWAVLSAFDKSVERTEVLKYDLPYADGNRGFWKTPIRIQHPLAQMEIVPWDSSLTLLFSKNKEDVDAFLNYFPQSEPLEDYINRR